MNPSDEPDLARPHPASAARRNASAAPAERPPLIRRQRKVQADWREVERFLDRLTGSLAPAPYSVCIVSDRVIRRYNRQYRQKDEATDVLSFPAGRGRVVETEYLGDILISAEMAQSNAARFGLRVEDEIKTLVLHGLLHLLGGDHERDRGQMARSERRWAKRLGLPQTVIARAAGPGTPRGRRRGGKIGPRLRRRRFGNG